MPNGPRVALVGLGRWGRHILRDLISLGCSVPVVDRFGKNRVDALRAGAANVVSSVDALTSMDGVVVATPAATHAEVLDQVLDRFDVPVFVEKPLTADPASARRLLDRAADRIFIMHQWRYHPGIEALRDIGGSGELGPISGLRSTRVQWGTSHTDVDGIWTLAPHDLSIALEILGHIPPTRAAAGEWAGEDLAGLVGILGDDPWTVIEVSVSAPERRREVRLHCRGGTATLGGPYADHIDVRWRGRDDPEKRPIDTELPLLRELRAFVGHLTGGPPPKSSVTEGVAIVEAIAELRTLARLEDRSA